MGWLKLIFLLCFFSLGQGFLQGEEEVIALRFWQFCIQEEILRPLLDEFESKNPGIRVEVERLTWSNGLDKILIASSTGTGPDLCELGSTWVSQFISAHKLVNLTRELAPKKSQYLMWEPVEDEEKQLFGAPWLIGTRILFYRKDWLRTEGFKEPAQNLTEFSQHLARLHKPDEKKWGYGIPIGEVETTWKGFLPYLWTIHGLLLNQKKLSTLSQGTALEALSYYQKIQEFSLCDKAKNLDRSFVRGQLGYHLSGPWLFKRIQKENPGLEYGITCFPGTKKNSGFSFLGGEVLVLFKKKESKKEKAAKKLLAFMLEKKNMLAICKDQSNLFPPLLGLENTAFIQKDAKHKILYQQIQKAKHPPCLPEWNAISKVINTEIERLVQEKKSPKKILSQMHNGIDKILNPSKTKVEEASRWPYLILLLLASVAFVWGGRGKEQGNIPWLWLSPFLLLFSFFQFYPILYTFYLSLTTTEFLSDQVSFVGLYHYKTLWQDSFFRQAFWQTMIFALGTVPFNIILGLLVACFLDQLTRFKTFLRVTFFIPTVSGLIVTALIFSYLYEQNGLLNYGLQTLGLGEGKNWLMEKDYALYSIMAMAVWSSFGYYAILFLGGLKTISPALYEAAKLDGATPAQCFWHITIPQLRPFLLFAVLLNTIRSLQVFPEIFTMTQGGPEGTTATAVYYIYQTGFQEYQLGKACAASFILVGAILIIAVIQKGILGTGNKA